MSIEAFRIQNFMGFADSGWIELRPITLLFGRNSSGKSAILRALLLLQQSMSATAESGPLLFAAEDGFDFGDYHAMVRNHAPKEYITFSFRHRFRNPQNAKMKKQKVIPEMAQFNRLEKILRILNIISIDSQPDEIMLMSELTYRLNSKSKKSDLYEFAIRDKGENVVWRATAPIGKRLAVGEAWEQFSNRIDLAYDSAEPWPEIELFIRYGFFPNLRVVGGNEYVMLYSNETGEELDELPLTRQFDALRRLTAQLYTDLRSFLQVTYLGPLRPEPRRYYNVAAQPGNSLARSNERFVRNYLDAKKTKVKKNQIAQIDRWLKDSQLGAKLEIKALDARKSLYEVEIKDVQGTQLTTNLREVGSGVSQVLPVITQALLLTEGSLAIIEQPELHLHPSAQAELGDLFISAAKNGARFLIETHSEHLLYRLQRRIAESSLAEHRRRHHKVEDTDHKAQLEASDVSVYFISRTKGESEKTAITFDEWGRYIEQPEAFQTFFSNDLDELLALDDARLEAMQEETE